MRFPFGFGNMPVCVARAASRPDSWIGRLSALTENRRHHAHQGHRDALKTHLRKASTGALQPIAFRIPNWRQRPILWSTNFAAFPLSRSAQRKSFSTTPKMQLSRLPLSSKAIATAACVNRTTFEKVSRLSMPSAKRHFAEVRALRDNGNCRKLANDGQAKRN